MTLIVFYSNLRLPKPSLWWKMYRSRTRWNRNWKSS